MSQLFSEKHHSIFGRCFIVEQKYIRITQPILLPWKRAPFHGRLVSLSSPICLPPGSGSHHSRASRVAPRPHTHTHPVFSLPLSLSYLGSLRQQRAVNHQAFFSALCLISPWYIWREGSLLCRGNHSAHRHLPPLPLHSSLKLQNQGIVYLEGLGAFPHTVTTGWDGLTNPSLQTRNSGSESLNNLSRVAGSKVLVLSTVPCSFCFSTFTTQNQDTLSVITWAISF